MRDLHNVEKSTFRKGEYVGYANGVWRIRKRAGGAWRGDKDGASVYGATLADISSELDAVDAANTAARRSSLLPNPFETA